MSTDDQDGNLYPFTPPPPPPSSSPPSRPSRKPRRSRFTKTAAGLALILGAGAGAAAVASATTSGPSTSHATATTTPGRSPNTGPGPRGRRFFGPAMPGGPMRSFGFGGFGGGLGPIGAIHASYTVKGPNGSYETIDTQYGTAEVVSSGSITVKSADGFSQTYTVGSSTVVDADYNGILSVKVGDTISIQGLVSGSTVTAERVLDVTQVQANRKSWAPGPPNFSGGPGRPGGPGGPSGSSGGGGSAA